MFPLSQYKLNFAKKRNPNNKYPVAKSQGVVPWIAVRFSIATRFAQNLKIKYLLSTLFSKETPWPDQENHGHTEVHGHRRIRTGYIRGKCDNQSDEKTPNNRPAQASESAHH